MQGQGDISQLIAAHGRIKLTQNQRGILSEGAAHKDGVVRPTIAAGFAGVVTRKNVRKLEALGLIVPSPHGDHYITDAGRVALAKSEAS